MVNLFGGKAAREGGTSTVAVKGDRKAIRGDANGQFIDLNEEKIYDLDLKKKTYTAINRFNTHQVIMTVTVREKGKTLEQGGGGLGGRLGGMIARKIGPKADDAAKPRATFMTMNTEVLKVAARVAPEDVAIPAGFKEGK